MWGKRANTLTIFFLLLEILCLAAAEGNNMTGVYAASTSYQTKCTAGGVCTYMFSLTVPGHKVVQGVELTEAGKVSSGERGPQLVAVADDSPQLQQMQDQIHELTLAINTLTKGSAMTGEIESLRKEVRRARKYAKRMNRNSQELMVNVGQALKMQHPAKAGKGQGRNQTNQIVTFQADASNRALRAKVRRMEKQMKKLEAMTQHRDYQAGHREESILIRVEEPTLQRVGMDCAALRKNGMNISSIYKVQPDPKKKETGFYVYCDMELDGGGWTVVQRREDGTEDFNQTWSEYKDGFGDLEFEYWLGLEKLLYLNLFGNKQIRFDIWDFKDKHYYANYNRFKLSNEEDGYKIMVGDYSGTAGDAFHYANRYLQHHNMRFSTRDKDHDKSGRNCAKMYGGGWWYQNCMVANLNGIYYNVGQGHSRYASKVMDGIMWQPLDNYKSFKRTEIKVRPPHFKDV